MVKIEVNSITRNEIPEIKIHFFGGSVDELILERYYPNEESRLDPEYHKTCSYFGHLKNEVGACVAVTGCYGKDDMHFTILSRYVVLIINYSASSTVFLIISRHLENQMYSLKNDGELETIIDDHYHNDFLDYDIDTTQVEIYLET